MGCIWLSWVSSSPITAGLTKLYRAVLGWACGIISCFCSMVWRDEVVGRGGSAMDTVFRGEGLLKLL